MPDETAHEWLPVPDVAELLGVTPSQVRRLIEDRALLATPIDGIVCVPRDFIHGSEPLAYIAGTVTVLIDGGFSEADALWWLISPEETLGVSPARALSQGRKTEVRRVAQTLAI